jgi:predicted RNA-binding protein YlxR (DUF448 family)
MKNKLTPAEQQLLELLQKPENVLMSNTWSSRGFWIENNHTPINNNVARSFVMKCCNKVEDGTLKFRYILKDEYKYSVLF